jgi:hypothetical protein
VLWTAIETLRVERVLISYLDSLVNSEKRAAIGGPSLLLGLPQN